MARRPPTPPLIDLPPDDDYADQPWVFRPQLQVASNDNQNRAPVRRVFVPGDPHNDSLALIDWESDHDPNYSIEIDQLIDYSAWDHYMCVICREPAREPQYHFSSPSSCRTLWCTLCLAKVVNLNLDSRCPVNCDPAGEALIYSTAPLPDSRDGDLPCKSKMDKLKLKCKFKRCNVIMQYKEYKEHIDICPKNTSWYCYICDINCDITAHDCATYFAEVRKKYDLYRTRKARKVTTRDIGVGDSQVHITCAEAKNANLDSNSLVIDGIKYRKLAHPFYER